MKVKQFDGVSNQLIINDDENNVYFQSYDSIIVKQDRDGNITLDEKTWDYSRTTGKYRNRFLGETKAETQKKIESGEYTLENLNPTA